MILNCPWCITGGTEGKQPVLSELVEEPAEEQDGPFIKELTFKCLRCGYSENRNAEEWTEAPGETE